MYIAEKRYRRGVSWLRLRYRSSMSIAETRSRRGVSPLRSRSRSRRRTARSPMRMPPACARQSSRCYVSSSRPSSEARSGYALGERLEHLDLNLRRALEQPAEVLLGDDQRPHRRRGRHRGRPGGLRHERDLAQEVARTERPDLPPFPPDVGVALDQDEELAAAAA